jgi:hypothetical protein
MKKKKITRQTKVYKYRGVCPKCKKIILATDDDIVLSGSPPEFPFLIKGHCGLTVPMDRID